MLKLITNNNRFTLNTLQLNADNND